MIIQTFEFQLTNILRKFETSFHSDVNLLSSPPKEVLNSTLKLPMLLYTLNW